MSKEEKQICSEIMRDGHIVRVQNAMSGEGILICHLVVCGGQFYTITKLNDEYIYFFHHITTDGLGDDVEYCKEMNIPLNYRKGGNK